MSMRLHNLRRQAVLGPLWGSGRKRQIKARLLAADPHCRYCGSLIDDVAKARLDHFYPVMQYPELAQSEDNLVLSCISCDQFKADIDPSFFGPREAFMRYMATTAPRAGRQSRLIT